MSQESDTNIYLSISSNSAAPPVCLDNAAGGQKPETSFSLHLCIWMFVSSYFFWSQFLSVIFCLLSYLILFISLSSLGSALSLRPPLSQHFSPVSVRCSGTWHALCAASTAPHPLLTVTEPLKCHIICRRSPTNIPEFSFFSKSDSI